jgi:HK97 family phage major capsid protein
MKRRLMFALLAAVGTEPTSGGAAPAVPPLSPDVLRKFFDAASTEARSAAAHEMAKYGLTVRTAEVKSWKPYRKAHEETEASIIEVLPPVSRAFIYEANDPERGAKGIRAAQFIKAQMIAQKTSQTIERVAADLLARGKIDPFVAKALMESTTADGGTLVPPQFAAEIIPLLRAATVLRESGVRVVPMESSQLIYARQNAPATASYAGETQVQTHSQAKTGALKLSAKKLSGITSVTDELLEDAGAAADEFIRDDLVFVLALKMDLAGIRGDGTQETPMGLLFQVIAANKFHATQAGSAATFIEVNADLSKAIRLVEESNVPLRGCGWLMAPRVKTFLMTILNAQGFYMFRDEMTKGTLLGYPFKVTTQIPTNLGGSGIESEIYFGPFPQYILGEKDELIVQMFPGGAYNDASGNVVSGISTGTTPIRGTMRHDFQLRYTNCFAVIDQVKYGG